MIAMTDDLVFAHIMACKKEYVKRLIHYITDIPLEQLQDLEYIDTNITEDFYINKHHRSDVATQTNKLNVILEMNKKPKKEYVEKNISYLFAIHNQENRKGEKYITGKKYLLINFDYYGKVGKKLINKYVLTEDNGEKYPVEIEVYHIKLDKLQNKEYTKSVKTEILKYLKIMVLDDETEIKKISKGDEILEDVVREMIHYGNKDIPFGYRDVDEEHEWMMNNMKYEAEEKGHKKGIKEGLEQAAKIMLLNGYDIKEINKITKISPDKIKGLKDTINIS